MLQSSLLAVAARDAMMVNLNEYAEGSQACAQIPQAAGSEQCVPPNGHVWLNGLFHKTGTYLVMDIMAAIGGGGAHYAYAVGDLEHKHRNELSPREYGPHEHACHQSQNYVGPDCALAMNASRARALVAAEPLLPFSTQTEIQDAISETYSATGLSVKLMLWHRDPLQRTLSAYGYHLAGTEQWMRDAPSPIVARLHKACQDARKGVGWLPPYNPAADVELCAALNVVLKRERTGRKADGKADGTGGGKGGGKSGGKSGEGKGGGKGGGGKGAHREISYTQLLALLSVEHGGLLTAWYLHNSHVEMARLHSLVSAGDGFSVIADLDSTMADCHASFTRLFSAIGLEESGGTLSACVELGCAKIEAGKSSHHATSSLTSAKGGANVLAARQRLREWLPRAPWFREHVQPLRVRMGYA